ncbi:MAG: type 1 periplasmic-binding domain-containing protein [Acidimicrobiales bacterium]
MTGGRGRRGLLVILGAGLLVMTACGTTVPLRSQYSAGPNGLGAGGASGVGGQTGAGATGSSDLSGTGSAPSVPGAGLPSGAAGGASSGVAGGAGTVGTKTRGAGSRSGGAASQAEGPAAGGGGPAAGRSGGASPISVGVLYSTNSAAQAALGVSTSTSFDSTSVAKALIAYYNSHGGLAGHRLSGVYHGFGADDPSFDNDLQQACADFTQDHHVNIVIDLAGAWSATFQQCLASAHVPYFGAEVSDDQDMRTYPGLINPSDRSMDDRGRAVIDTLSATGYLSRRNKIGVLFEQCPNTQRANNNGLVADARRHGLTVASTYGIGCITGFASSGSDATQLQEAVLQFQSSGVDRVMFMSNYESALLLLFSRAAENANWHPGYALDSNAGAGSLAGSLPPAQTANIHGAGWMPNADINSSTPVSTSGQRCLSMLAPAGIRPASSSDASTAYSGCEELFLLERVLGVNNRLDYRSIIDSVSSLGSTFVSTVAIAGATAFSATRHAAAADLAPFAYSAACSCIAYTAAPSGYL